MAKQYTIGTKTFNYPDAGENPGWGEDATDWAGAVTDALQTVQGPNDILLTSATLANNQTSATNIPGLSFNVAQVEAVEIDYYITRTFDSGSTVISERGKILGDYNGTDFIISTESSGDTGVDFFVTSGGQFQYTSSDLTNHTSSTIRFSAKTIDTP